MIIKFACEQDIPRISELLLQVCNVHAQGRPDLFKAGGYKYSPEELKNIIADKDRPIFAAIDESGLLVGYCFCELQDHRGDTAMTDIITLYIDDLCVDEKERGKHIGTELYNAVVAYAKEIGCYNITLNVWECNPSAAAFYKAVGMKPLKTGMETVL